MPGRTEQIEPRAVSERSGETLLGSLANNGCRWLPLVGTLILLSQIAMTTRHACFSSQLQECKREREGAVWFVSRISRRVEI